MTRTSHCEEAKYYAIADEAISARYKLRSALTLIELLIALTLFSIIILSFSNIELFTHFQVFSSDRRMSVQNEVSFLAEHIRKRALRAIGDSIKATKNGPLIHRAIDQLSIDQDPAIEIYIDGDATHPADGKWGTAGDHWVAYRNHPVSIGPGSKNYEVWYYDNYTNPNDPHEVIAQGIVEFNPQPENAMAGTVNYFDFTITACFDPANTQTPITSLCGKSPDNPAVTMFSRAKMPSVSTN